MTSPLHRDPESDFDNYGCFSEKANRKVTATVRRTILLLKHGEFGRSDEVIEFVRSQLLLIGDGAADTVVKENVFAALAQDMEEAGLDELDQMKIYGW